MIGECVRARWAGRVRSGRSGKSKTTLPEIPTSNSPGPDNDDHRGHSFMVLLRWWPKTWLTDWLLMHERRWDSQNLGISSYPIFSLCQQQQRVKKLQYFLLAFCEDFNLERWLTVQPSCTCFNLDSNWDFLCHRFPHTSFIKNHRNWGPIENIFVCYTEKTDDLECNEWLLQSSWEQQILWHL